MRVSVSLCFLFVWTILGHLVNGINDDRHQKWTADRTKRNVTPFDITFTLYTRKNPKVGQKLGINDMEKLKNSHFDPNKSTKIVTHGYFDSGNGQACTLIRDAYLLRSDYNVLIVGWSKHSFKIYYRSVDDVVVIGHEVARMIDFLHEKAGLDTERTSLIGYSLGAHVVGVAGYNTKFKVKHVFGLDPALPGFYFAGPDTSISKKSGQHVQIIHTNGGIMGYFNAAGHSDFFPNGGSKQSGCSAFDDLCSHDLVYRYFAESITRPFNGTLCNSYESFEAGDCGTDAYVAPMGDFNPEQVRPGKYYLRTGPKPPYSVL